MTASTIDPQFPQLPKILEPGYMLAALQNALFCNQESPTLKVESCSIGEKRHKPGKSFLLSYCLRLQHVATDVHYEQLMTAQLCLPGRGSSEFDAYRVKQTHSLIGIPSVSYIAELDTLLWAFPHDRKLVHLPKLLDTEKLRSYFTTHLSSLTLAPSEHIVSVRTKIMHYLPERSCMIRYTLVLADQLKADEFREIILYGKNYRDDSGFEVYSIMQQLAKQVDQCAKPYYYDMEIRTLWQSHVPGGPFEWKTLTLAGNQKTLAKVAACIAAFHGCTLDTAGRYDFSDISEQLEATCHIASVTDSILGKRVQAAVQAIRLNHEQIDWSNTLNTPIHLDLKMGNLLISDASVSLIDMDCVRLGDPLADIGSFVANLSINGLLAGSDSAQIDAVVTLFCNEYCAAVDWLVDHAKLNWHISAALIHEVIRRSLRQQNAERLKQVSAIIELSNYYSALCRKNISGGSYAQQ